MVLKTCKASCRVLLFLFTLSLCSRASYSRRLRWRNSMVNLLLATSGLLPRLAVETNIFISDTGIIVRAAVSFFTLKAWSWWRFDREENNKQGSWLLVPSEAVYLKFIYIILNDFLLPQQ
jgi:hypothetical protein